jgi:hypothetical protein
MEGKELEAAFTNAVMDTVKRVHEATRYTPRFFLQMVGTKGALAACRQLLDDPIPAEGFQRLYDEGMPEMSIEAMALQPWWKPLFNSPQRQEARRRLEELGVDVEMLIRRSDAPEWWRPQIEGDD